MVTNLNWIEFEDGTILSLSVAEGECEHYVKGTVIRGSQPGRTRRGEGAC